MNKNDLIAALADKNGIAKTEASKLVDSMLNIITESLRAGSEVRMVGFGTFSVTNRAASKGRNPRTGEVIDIPASKQAKFRAGKALKDVLNP